MRSDLSVSVVMPVYNAAGWLPETLGRAAASLRRAGVTNAEFVLVDDGSADDTAAAVDGIDGPFSIRYLPRPHRGRFLTRKTGILQARYDHVLLLDTRVHLHEEAIGFIAGQHGRDRGPQVWNGHVVVAKEGNVIARFGDAITFLGWRRYFARPRTTSYGLADFDHYPKGCGCFFAPKAALVAAMAEFERLTPDLEHANDDTLLIRILAREARINVSPGFACTYHARRDLRQFVRHTYHRGQVFVDGFLRPGTRFRWPLVAFLWLTVLGAAAILLEPKIAFVILPALLLAWSAEPVLALLLGVPAKDAWSLFALSPIFAVCYGLGIWRGFVRRLASASPWKAASGDPAG